MTASCDLFGFFADVPRYAGCRALLRTSRKELPTLIIRDLTVVSGPAPLPALPLDARVSAGHVYERRLRRLAPAALSSEGAAPRSGAQGKPASVAIVSGGLRGVGLRVGSFLLDDGRAQRVVLIARSPPHEKDRALVDALCARGAEVRLCDVGEWAAVEALPDADLVVHCAGAIDDQLMQSVTAPSCTAVLRPKVDGARNLKRRYADSGRLVAFSSSSALFGVAGQATYAAANAYLDETLGGDAVQWGGWGEVGMAVDHSISPTRGEHFLALGTGLQLLGKILDAPYRRMPTAALEVEWSEYARNTSIFAADEAPFCAGLAEAKTEAMAEAKAVDIAVQINSTSIANARGPSPKGSESLIGVHATHGVAHVFSLTLGACHGPWQLLRQHVVGGIAVAPASAYLAWVVAAVHALCGEGAAVVRLSDCRFSRMLSLNVARACTLTLMPENGEGGVKQQGVAVISCDGEVHARMAYLADDASTLVRLASSSEAITTGGLGDGRTIEQPYDTMRAQGYSYGPAFAQLAHLSVHGSRASADLVSSASATLQARGPSPCCPATLDAALQLVSFLDAHAGTGTPVAISELTWRVGALPARTLATEGAEGAGGAHVEMSDAAGELVGVASGLQMAASEAPIARLTFATLESKMGHADADGGAMDAVTADVATLAGRAIVSVGDESGATMTGAIRAVRAAAARAPTTARAAAPDACAFAAAAAHDANVPATDPSGRPLVWRLSSLELPSTMPSAVAADEPYVVRTDSVEGRVFFERAARPGRLSASEVEVRTTMWALNFRDVLVANGAISSVVAGRSLGIGGECYGVVERVGCDVRNVAPGDTVVAFPPDGMGSYLRTDARWVYRAAPGVEPSRAVSGTMVYATAWLALHMQARVKPGDDVLIHSAAGGVGLAAVALCLAAGCRVFATASTQEKRSVLLERGAKAVFNSRSTVDFTRGVRAATDGAGVDIVLNSLSGEALVASLRLLKPFGHMVELGKRDAYESKQIS